jgi:serine phosphatase RsbU (regulator of sigma subunit)
MTAEYVGSIAFQEARLKSERLRIWIVLAAIGAVLLLRFMRAVVVGGRENLMSLYMTAGLLALFAACELAMLRGVHRAIQTRRDFANWVWFANTGMEAVLPAFAVAFISSSSIDPAYKPLANPAGLGFFLFISLSTLRLDPTLCRVSGLTSAVSYLAAAAHLGWRPSMKGGESLLTPEKAVFGYAIAFILGGFVAGMIAGEIRKQVGAALREADTRRQLESVEHDLSLARSIQQSLLPNMTPQIAGFQIAGWNQPADQTGGDYYDWQVLPNGAVVAELADVTGHGIGPALLAAVCRAYARASFGQGNCLFKAMEQLNGELNRDIGEGRFVTLVAVVCAPGCPRVQLISAGHGPSFVYVFSQDRFEQIGAQGVPLGISSQFVSDPPKILELSAGDVLVLATDGFLEWTNREGEQFGAERFKQTIRQSKEEYPSDVISALYGAVLAFSGGTKQQDDLTAVVIKRT